LLHRACKTDVFTECKLCRGKTSSRGAKVVFYLSATRGRAPAAAVFWGTPLGMYSGVQPHGAFVKSLCGVSMETWSPQWGQGFATVPKRCHKRGLKATFPNPCASLWIAVAKKNAPCENPIIYNVSIPGKSKTHRKLISDPTWSSKVAREASRHPPVRKLTSKSFKKLK
jgi:hypothetical protein